MDLGNINIYWVMIGLSMVIILSYLFNYISSATRVPSVILLIATGFIISLFQPIEDLNLKPFLEFLGAVGLIMIVLEASLDLELKREKRGLIFKAVSIALLLLVINALATSWLIMFFYEVDLQQSLFYSIPLSIMSSAIIIPSVAHLDENKKEFLIYEGAFSDIFGIMFFYFLQDSLAADSGGDLAAGISVNILITLVVSFLLGYLVILLVQKVKGQVKLFLPIAVLILLYSFGKLLHLSALIFILVFGLMINNRRLFFKGALLRILKMSDFSETLKDLKVLTLETSFIVRTFFFIVFGMTITAEGINNPYVYVIGFGTIIILMVSRVGVLSIAARKSKFPAIYIAPRGLITILLFFAIPESQLIDGFMPATLLVVILVSNLIMTYGLMKYKPEGLGHDEIDEEEHKVEADRKIQELNETDGGNPDAVGDPHKRSGDKPDEGE